MCVGGWSCQVAEVFVLSPKRKRGWRWNSHFGTKANTLVSIIRSMNLVQFNCKCRQTFDYTAAFLSRSRCRNNWILIEVRPWLYRFLVDQTWKTNLKSECLKINIYKPKFRNSQLSLSLRKTWHPLATHLPERMYLNWIEILIVRKLNGI